MKSWIEDALKKSEPSRAPPPMPTQSTAFRSADDSELEEMLKNLKTRITIFGCGGGGSNTIQRIAEGDAPTATLVAANTDAQHLLSVRAPRKLLLGRRLTKGLGAGAVPKVGMDAALESEGEVKALVQGSDLVITCCGLGGGTGTGSIAVVSKIAKEMGALTISFVTLPFKGEGHLRMQNALWGLEQLRQSTDTVVVIPNDNILKVAPRLPVNMAFKLADEVLMRAVTGISQLITSPGLVNVDFNDLRTIMKDAGIGVIGLGESDAVGDTRIDEAVNSAANSPLLDTSIDGATGVLVNVTGGPGMTVSEAEKAIELLHGKIDPNARVIWGARVDPELKDKLQVMIIATGVRKTEHAPISEIKQVGETQQMVRQVRPAAAPGAAAASANPGRGAPPPPPVRRPVSSIFRR